MINLIQNVISYLWINKKEEQIEKEQIAVTKLFDHSQWPYIIETKGIPINLSSNKVYELITPQKGKKYTIWKMVSDPANYQIFNSYEDVTLKKEEYQSMFDMYITEFNVEYYCQNGEKGFNGNYFISDKIGFIPNEKRPCSLK